MIAFTNQLTLIIFCIMLLVTSGCDNTHTSQVKPDVGNGTLTNPGELPAAVKGHAEFAENEFQIVAYDQNVVFVATSDGLWRFNLKTNKWGRSGFQGKMVSCIFKHPTIADRLFAGIIPAEDSNEKPLYISKDGGLTWKPAERPIYDDLDKQYETYVCIAVRPDHPDHIYANLAGGTMIAVSTDNGNTWKRMNHEDHSNFGYRSNIVFIPGYTNQLFQGSENPFDDAWLGRYDIDPKDPVLLTNFTKVVDTNTFGNRRPVELQTNTFTGNSIYVGPEGALSKVTGTTTKFIFKSEENHPETPYTYIYGLWINPLDTDHIIFGGAVNGGQMSMNLFETFDEGKTIKEVTHSSNLGNLQIAKILATDMGAAIVAYDPDAGKIRLLLYKPE